jgi:hypothetical protein
MSHNSMKIRHIITLVFVLNIGYAYCTDPMEVDNGSPRDAQEGVKAVAFRAIPACSPIVQPQSLDIKNNIACHTNRPQCRPQVHGACCTPNGELDLGSLAIDADAMDDN